MGSQEEVLEDGLSPRAKKEILDRCILMQKELGKRQREYKNILLERFSNRADQIIEKSYANTIQRLQNDKNTLRAQIWVANGKAQISENERLLRLIKCHVKCQENLSKEIKKFKTDINHLERHISDVDRNIYELNLKTVPDEQHQDYVRHMRKKMSHMENSLEIGIRRECGFTAANAMLREELTSLLDHREFFNNWYTKLINKLNGEKKFVLELMKYAFHTFEDCTHFQEKVNHTINKMFKDNEHLKDEIQSTLRKSSDADTVMNFVEIKNTTRPVKPLHQKEIERRKEFSRLHSRKIDLYNRVLEQLLEYTRKQGGIKSVEGIIDTFQNQENIYYSYCSIANETDFHITLLNNAVNRLYLEINATKDKSRVKTLSDFRGIRELEDTYIKKKKKNEDLIVALRMKNHRLNVMFSNVTDIFNMSRCNSEPLRLLLGNQSHCSINNMRQYFKIIETRILGILASVYCSERKQPNPCTDKCVVKDIINIFEDRTDLDDIVLSCQCPECAESEAYNTDDVGGRDANVLTKEEVKKLLHEKVIQPEIQYRLHSLSQCRMPRSRLLVSKRTAE